MIRMIQMFHKPSKLNDPNETFIEWLIPWTNWFKWNIHHSLNEWTNWSKCYMNELIQIYVWTESINPNISWFKRSTHSLFILKHWTVMQCWEVALSIFLRWDSRGYYTDSFTSSSNQLLQNSGYPIHSDICLII